MEMGVLSHESLHYLVTWRGFSQGQIDIRDLLMFGNRRYPFYVVKEDREITQLFPAFGQPLTIQGIDAFADAVCGADMSYPRTAAAWDSLGDDPLGILRYGATDLAANVETERLRRGVCRIVVNDAEGAPAGVG